MSNPTLAYRILSVEAVKKISVAALNGLIKFLNILSEKNAFKAAELMGLMFYYFGSKTRAATIGSIKTAFAGISDEKARGIARSAFVNQSKNLVELMRYPSLKKRDISRKIKFEGLENLTSALARGKGVILLVAHIGNWELLGAVWGLLGHRVYSFFLDARIDAIGKLLNDLRESRGIKLIPRAELKKSVQCLRENALLGVIADQDGGENGVYTKFFGRTVSAPRGPAALARNTGATILPNFLIRNSDGTYTMIMQKPIVFKKTSSKEADIKNYTDRFLEIYEKMIGQYPEQWLWMYDRWKERRHVTAYLKELEAGSAGPESVKKL
ncbi:MAG TPA: lysophospholipid acyltransferase family protein [Candidatus Wallbacteria bacterium]|nr:lysophospholipid acyltransferase family protein [Candidatus Wallbacteria bacterium]